MEKCVHPQEFADDPLMSKVGYCDLNKFPQRGMG
jgi:hypothetical protein